MDQNMNENISILNARSPKKNPIEDGNYLSPYILIYFLA